MLPEQDNSEVFKEQEEEEKRTYQQRVLDVEMGSFTPLVFGTNVGMGNECQRFLKHLADKIAQKETEPYNTVIAWIRTKIYFELLRSVHACVRGSRTAFSQQDRTFLRLQKKRRHCGHLKFLGCSCIIYNFEFLMKCCILILSIAFSSCK